MSTKVDIFSQHRSDKNYSTAAIDDLITYCEQQTAPVYQTQIIPLLKATKRFRNLADPGPYFTTLRNDQDNTVYLEHTIKEIADVFVEAETKMAGSTVLTAAMAYCTESIINRLNDLGPNDKIITIYKQGE